MLSCPFLGMPPGELPFLKNRNVFMASPRAAARRSFSKADFPSAAGHTGQAIKLALVSTAGDGACGSKLQASLGVTPWGSDI